MTSYSAYHVHGAEVRCLDRKQKFRVALPVVTENTNHLSLSVRKQIQVNVLPVIHKSPRSAGDLLITERGVIPKENALRLIRVIAIALTDNLEIYTYYRVFTRYTRVEDT